MKDLNELRELLIAARAAAAAPLSGNPAWEALQRLRNGADVPSGGAAPKAAASQSGDRLQTVGSAQAAVALEQTLGSDAVYQLVAKIDEALALIAGIAAGSDAGRFTKAAPAQAPVAMPEDDLTRIRGIRPALAADLKLIGVHNYRQIARWTAADVRRVSDALALGSTIHQQGWIEQAAMLDARRPPAAAVARPVVAAIVAASGSAADGADKAGAPGIGGLISGALAGILAQVAASPEQARSLPAPVQAAASQEAPSAGPRPFDVAAAAPMPPHPAAASEVEPAVVVSASAMAVVNAASIAAAKPSVVVAEPVATVPVAAEPAAKVAPVAAAPVVPLAVPTAPAAPPDDLEAIRGIDAATARALSRQGVRRYADIARMSAAEVVACEVRLLQPLRLRREGWVEQAALLARGELTAFERQRRAGLVLPLAQADRSPWTVRPPAGGAQPTQVSAASPSVNVPGAQPGEPDAASAASDKSSSPTKATPTAPAVAASSAEPPPPPIFAASVVSFPAAVVAQSVPPSSAQSAPPSTPPPAPLPELRVPVLDQVSTIRPATLAAAIAPTPPAERLAGAKPPRLADFSERERRRLERAGEALAPGMAASLAAAAAAGLTLSEAEGVAGGLNRKRSLADAVTTLAPRAASVNLRQWQSDAADESAGATGAASAMPEASTGQRVEASDEAFAETDLHEDADSFLDPAAEAEVVIVPRGGVAGGQGADAPPVTTPTGGGSPTPADSIRARLARRAVADADADEGDSRMALEEASVEIVIDGAPVRTADAPNQLDQTKQGGFRRLVKALTSDGKAKG